MWRNWASHKRGETEYLDAALERLRKDADLTRRADAVLHAASGSEPLLHDALKTPQSPPHHCEGPFMEYHVRNMLTVLFGILEGRLHLIDIEEFRRMKGYEGEIDELEETIKENAAFFEVFCLCHDAAKWASVSFEGLPGSRGEKLGFRLEHVFAREEIGISERAKMRERYVQLFDAFAAEHANVPGPDLEAAFFEAYGIRVHYLGHDRMIHSPNYRSLLRRACAAHALTERDTELLEDIIAHHLDPIADFSERRPGRIKRYHAIAHQRGYDADDFIDILQACLFLDDVCGSQKRSAHGGWYDPSILIHFFQSEHDYAPHQRAEKTRRRELEKLRVLQQTFRAAELDGVALMELIGMEPGPRFGELLRAIHAGVLGEGTMPAFPPRIKDELTRRIDRFYSLVFPQGV